MWFHIDDRVVQLAEPNFRRKRGLVKGTFELVAHENDMVVLEEDVATVTVLQVVHTRQHWPKAQTGGYSEDLLLAKP